MKTWVGVLCLICFGSLVQAETPSDPQRFFADCAGRLAAEMEHQWLLSEPGSELTMAQFNAMRGILNSMTPEAQASEVRVWLLQAKVAHQALLSRATFQGSAWAADRAAAHVSACTALVVG